MPTYDTNQEVARIEAAYERRATVVPDRRYSHFDTAYLYAVQHRERILLKLLRSNGFEALDGKTILEIGCGTGFWLREFIRWGAEPARIVGVDLLQYRIDKC